MIIVTGASGHLGRHVVTGLLDKLPAGQVVAAARSPEKAADLGVAVRRADHDEPDTLLAALEGAETVLLISGSEVGERVRQHRAVIDAARKAGVARLVYTSILNAGRPLVLAPEHQATEEAHRRVRADLHHLAQRLVPRELPAGHRAGHADRRFRWQRG